MAKISIEKKKLSKPFDRRNRKKIARERHCDAAHFNWFQPKKNSKLFDSHCRVSEFGGSAEMNQTKLLFFLLRIQFKFIA